MAFLRKCGVKWSFALISVIGTEANRSVNDSAMLGAGETPSSFCSRPGSMLQRVTYLFMRPDNGTTTGVFAIAIGTAVLRAFSRHVCAGNMDELKSSISFAAVNAFWLFINVRFWWRWTCRLSRFCFNAVLLTRRRLFIQVRPCSFMVWAYGVFHFRVFVQSF